MNLNSPRSPIAQFSIENDHCSTSNVCPNAPRKPNFRREQEIGNFDFAIRCARDMLESMPECDRCDALKHLPRHTLEGVFLAFCHWQAGTQGGMDFQMLLQVAPCLDQELLGHIQCCYPNMTGEEWAIEVQQAVSDPYHGQQLAERTMIDSCQLRRLLF
ncbi:hypothetical protein Vretifemale_8089 [Volvox reticuliferus]|uniref:Uncharacterized protein n=1 Tax=Volvox reticuliferus TaxID=1737510 RepID=A0A8J4CBU0_9CHLO|nr:hypothetical protein Vretifemale_8089 [Volvox reticuliferus]